MSTPTSVDRLDQLIAKGEAVLRTHRPNPPNVIGFPTLDSGAFSEWRTQSLACLGSLFGYGHVYVEDFKARVKDGYFGMTEAGLGILKAAKEDVASGRYGHAAGHNQPDSAATGASKQSVEVFVVHGHDDEMKQHAARTLSQLGLTPVILHEQPNAGRTVIEKFEDNADVGFAVVLLSPDDLAFSAAASPKQAKPRARQNVILELGYFVGALGRHRVFTLKKGDALEVPSDFSGVVYTSYDPAGHWRVELARELKAAGYPIDLNRLI